MDPLYSAEQIQIPPALPEILKNYTKFILKTQPVDILTSSAEYLHLMQIFQPAGAPDPRYNQDLHPAAGGVL